MDRREFIQAGIAATVGVAAAPSPASAAPRRRPNVLYAFSDQHRALSLPGEEYHQVVAPNIDAFRRANMSMEQCISNYPLCTPYRGILISGRWPYQTGITRNNIPIGDNEYGLGQAFRDAGYHTGYVGKWHLQGNDVSFVPSGPGRQGFEDWHAWGKTNAHYHSWTYDQDTGAKIQPEGWNGTLMTDEAITFLKAQTGDKPWMLVISWNPPHPPFNPPRRDAEVYPPEDLKLRPNVRLPLAGRDVEGPAKPLTSDDEIRKATRGYYGGITGIDKEFARLLRTLDDLNLTQDTIVVYTSDHGEMLGSQGRMSKQVPFEESCRVPFFVRYPGITPRGGTSDALFAAIDIYPTLCGLAGIPVPPHCAGRDVSSILRGQPAELQDAVFLMNEVSDKHMDLDDESDEPPAADQVETRRETIRYTNLPSFRGLRTRSHTYAVAADGRWCLYDNVADPYQMKNLVRDPGQHDLMATFDAAIAAWLKQTGDPFGYGEATTQISPFPS